MKQFSDWLRCAAAVNVCMIRVWSELLPPGARQAYREYGPPSSETYAAAILLTLGGATALFWALRLVRPLAGRVLICAPLALVAAKEILMAAGNLAWFERGVLFRWVHSWRMLALAAAALLLMMVLGRRYGSRLAWAVQKAATAGVPVVALTLCQAAVHLVNSPASATGNFEQLAASRRPAAQRAVWIIFDELDEDVAFARRPASFRLPALDRFRREANFVALHARAPANATSISVPSLLRGQQAGEFDFSSEQVFSPLHARGLRAGVVGWYLPYCRELARQLDACYWWPMSRQGNSFGTGIPRIMANQVRSLFETTQTSVFGQSLAVEHHAEVIRESTERAAALASRPDLDFVFLHLPAPHNPYLYNPVTGKLDAVPRPNGYWNNLLLADAIFERIRSAMEFAGVWESSTVLVTADHGFRSRVNIGYQKDDLHVPFLWKSPQPVDADPRAAFDTLRTKDLFLDLLGVAGESRDNLRNRYRSSVVH